MSARDADRLSSRWAKVGGSAVGMCGLWRSRVRLVAGLVAVALVVAACDTAYVYDEQGRLVGVTTDEETVTYEYDEAGNVVGIDRYPSDQVSVIEFSPDRGDAGMDVVVFGTGFSETLAENSVSFAGTAATVTAATTRELRVTVPAGAATGAIAVTTPNGSATSGESFTVEADRSPSVTGISPTVVAPTDVVTITGSSFDADRLSNAVVVGQSSYLTVDTASASQLVVRAPPVATTGPVSVATAEGTGEGPADLWVVPPPYAPETVEFTGRATIGGGPAALTVGTAGRVGLVAFEGAVGQRVSLTFTDNTFATLPRVKLFGPAGVEVASLTGWSQVDFIMGPLTLPASGTFMLVFDPTWVLPAAGTVSVAVHAVPADVSGEITADGSVKTVQLPAPGQVAEYTFEGSAGQRLSLIASDSTFTSVGITGAQVRLLGPDGAQVARLSVLSLTDESFLAPVELPSDGTYRLVVDPAGVATGSVDLRLFDVVDIVGNIEIDGAAVTANVTAPGQGAEYTFSGAAGQRVSLATSDNTIPGNAFGESARVRVVAADGTVVVEDTLDENDDLDMIGPVALPADGSYRLVLDPNIAGIGSVVLRLHEVVDVTGSIVADGPAVPVTITTPGQNAEYTFTGAAGQRVSVAASGSTLNDPNPFSEVARIRLVASDGAVVADTRFRTFEAAVVVGPAGLPAADIYRVVVDPVSAGTGAVTVSLHNAPEVTGEIVVDGPEVTATVIAPGQNPEYTFAGAAGQSLSLALTEDTFPSCSPRVRVFAPTGAQIASTSCVEGSRTLSVGTLAATGTHRVVVDPSDVTVGSVTLRLTTTAAVAAPEDAAVEASRDAGSWGPAPGAFDPTVQAAAQSDAAVAAATTLTGEVRNVNGTAISGVAVSVEGTRVTTNSSGRFTMTLPDGVVDRQRLVVDGSTATQPGLTFGTFVGAVDVTEGTANQLGHTVWLAPLDTANTVTLTYPLTADVVVTSPQIPGLEVRVPAGGEIRDLDGDLVTEVGLSPIPADKPPFPLPEGTTASTIFTFQPGGVAIAPEGLGVVYPNSGDEPPGAIVPLFDYTPEDAWEHYAAGEVSSDGTQILSGDDDGLGRFSGFGAVIDTPGFVAPPEGVNAGTGPSPVDLATGLFTHTATDLAVADLVPLAVTRSYRHDDTAPRAFGRGWSFGQDFYLYVPLPYDEAQLILPEGVRLDFQRTDDGPSIIGATFEHRSTPTAFFGSTLRWLSGRWELTTRDGTVFTFTDTGYLFSVRDSTGKQITIRRQGQSPTGSEAGNIAAIYGPLGRWVAFDYDADNRITSVRDHAGRTVSYTYDAPGRLETVTDPAGRVIRYGYDTQHRLTTVTDQADAVVLTNQYGTDNRVSRQILADDTGVDFAYQTNSDGQVTQTDVTAPDGTVRRVTFDDGYWLTDTAAHGTALEQTVTVERDPDSRAVTAQVDQVGRRVDYDYDDFGNVIAVTALAGTADEVTSTYTYDPDFNKVATETDPLDHTTTYSYDTEGNLATVQDPADSVTSYDYDQWGRVTSVTDALDHTSTVGYELLHRVTATNPLGHTTSQFIDTAGRATVVSDAVGDQVRVGYDALDRPTTMADSSGDEISVGYDPVGNLETFTDQAGNTTGWDYDDMARVTSRTDPLGVAETFDYDPMGRLVEDTDRRGVVTGYDYDTLGRVERTEFGVTPTGSESSIDYTYDPAGRLDQVDDTAYGLVDLAFDDFDRLTSESTSQGVVTYDYDDAGQRTSMSVTGGPTTSYGYDGAGRLSTITQGAALVDIGDRDAVGRVTEASLPNGITASYEFDAAGQLTRIVYDSALDESADPLGDVTYGYDPAGRRRVAGGSLITTLFPDAVTTTTHDAANRVTEWDGATLTYDDAGNLTSDGTSTYTWNARGELTGIDGPVDATFAYDPFGRRTENATGADTTSYLYDGANIVGEQHSGGDPVGYITGGVDEVFARTTSGGLTTYLADGLGSTIGLVDDTGTIATSYDYGPFGSTATQGAADPNPFQFTGREHDQTGLYYYRARYYDPDLGRFISEDPIGLSSGDPNLYAYVANSPTNGTDPSGLCNLGLIAEEFVLLEQYHTEASALIVQFQSGAIGSDDFVAAFRAAGHALTTGALAAAAINCTAGIAGGFGFPGRGGGGAGGFGRGPGRGGVSGFIDPSDVRFTQDSIRHTFRDGGSVSDLAAGLRSGSIQPVSVSPIRLVEYDGTLFTLDNRRLAAFGQAGVQAPFRMATADEIAREWIAKFTTKTDGLSIQLRFW